MCEFGFSADRSWLAGVDASLGPPSLICEALAAKGVVIDPPEMGVPLLPIPLPVMGVNPVWSPIVSKRLRTRGDTLGVEMEMPVACVTLMSIDSG